MVAWSAAVLLRSWALARRLSGGSAGGCHLL